MPFYALSSNGQLVGVTEAEGATGLPPGSLPLTNYAGIPPRPTPWHRLEVAGGTLAWVPGDTAAAWAGVRAQRDKLLAACDWRVVYAADRGGVASAAWAVSPWRTYRQALRDITAQADPCNISWPTVPAQE